MKATRLVGLALRSIQRNVGRSLLTMLGVVIGVGSVVVMVAIGQGAQAEIQARVDNLGTNMIVVTPGASSRGGVSKGWGSFNRLTTADADRLRREGPLLAAVSPVVFTRSNIVGISGNWRTTIYGVDTDYEQIRAWPAQTGRWFGPDEVKSRRKVCLLGQSILETVFEGNDPIGQRVRLRGVPFEVIGTLIAKGQTADGNDQDDVILAPYTTVQTRLSGHQFIPQILASALSQDDVAPAIADIKQVMREAHRLTEDQDDDFEVKDQRQLAQAAQGTTSVMTTLLAAIASVSLVVGGIGIMNIMLVSVSERTHEIGVRRAIGARRADVLAQFLVESVVLSGLGGLVGATLGIAVTQAIARFTGWATAVTPATIGLALAFSVAVGVFFGWYPARRAAALDVVDALRHG
ncbi:MAG: FtsX-like permease family protein [Oligoflexia bacterium]|nr:FtsX-like permease family protein [Oligoflexia bacterium]